MYRYSVFRIDRTDVVPMLYRCSIKEVSGEVNSFGISFSCMGIDGIVIQKT